MTLLLSPRRPFPRHPAIRALALSALSAALLSACGGGDDDRVATQAVIVTVIDGALNNAKVCVDSNQNQVCDTTELTARTNAQGVATFVLPRGQALGRLLAEVGTDASDADTGPVTQAYRLTTPAGQTVLSPLTTLVAGRMSAGQTQSQAEAAVRTQWALPTTVSLMGNYVAQRSQGGDALRLSVLARATVLQASQAAGDWAGAASAVASQLTPLTQTTCFQGTVTTPGAACDGELRTVLGLGPAPSQPSVAVNPASSALNGQALYATHCAVCHTSNPAYNASRVLAARTASTLLGAIARNVGGMGMLSGPIQAQQAEDIAAYLSAF